MGIFDNLLIITLALELSVLLTPRNFAIGMAWRSHGRNNTDLIKNLRLNGVIRSDVVENIMLQVDRGNYTKMAPYMDSPQGIGYGVTISAPHMVIFILFSIDY